MNSSPKSVSEWLAQHALTPEERENAAAARGSTVRLPTFEELVPAPPTPEPPEEEAEQGEDAVVDEEAAARSAEEEELSEHKRAMEREMDQTRALCAQMRREALAESDRIIDAARQEAVSIRDKARRETVERLRAENDERRIAEQAMVEKAAKLIYDERELLFLELEPYLLELTMHICEGILQYELNRDEEAYLSIIQNALDLLRTEGKARKLHLPPQGYDRLVEGEGGPAFLERMRNLGVEVIRDAGVMEGDCLVDSSIGGVRAGAATQLSRIRYAVTSTENMKV